jgi:hypothetical protein
VYVSDGATKLVKNGEKLLDAVKATWLGVPVGVNIHKIEEGRGKVRLVFESRRLNDIAGRNGISVRGPSGVIIYFITISIIDSDEKLQSGQVSTRQGQSNPVETTLSCPVPPFLGLGLTTKHPPPCYYLFLFSLSLLLYFPTSLFFFSPEVFIQNQISFNALQAV